jgi:hypothetical protein
MTKFITAFIVLVFMVGTAYARPDQIKGKVKKNKDAVCKSVKCKVSPKQVKKSVKVVKPDQVRVIKTTPTKKSTPSIEHNDGPMRKLFSRFQRQFV